MEAETHVRSTLQYCEQELMICIKEVKVKAVTLDTL